VARDRAELEAAIASDSDDPRGKLIQQLLQRAESAVGVPFWRSGRSQDLALLTLQEAEVQLSKLLSADVLLEVPLKDVKGARSMYVDASRQDIPPGVLVEPRREGRAVATARATRPFSDSLQQLEPILRELKDRLGTFAPASYTVEFGVRFGGEGGFIWAKASGDVSLKITMSWDRERGGLSAAREY
jgi:hypothetical protein